MCRAMEELIEKVLRRNRLAAAQRMLATGKLTPEEIAYYVDLSLDEVRQLAAAPPP